MKKNDPVCICFEEDAISALFDSLLRSRGVPTQEIAHISDLVEGQRTITEPKFIRQMPRESLRRCLVVGHHSSATDNAAVVLSRPLTEGKVEEAIERLLLL